MHYFWNAIIEPLLTRIAPRVIVEIGSDLGYNTANLLGHAQRSGAVVCVVDPSPKYDPLEWAAKWGETFKFHRALSLNALYEIDDMDAVLIDGDHNWYTVKSELELIRKQTVVRGRPFPMVLLHDVGWPYGRRDLYYDPSVIPDAYRHPYRQAGMKPKQAELIEGGGLNPHLNNSIHENSLRSGVRTALEDFVADFGAEYELHVLPAFFGLGVLYRPQDFADRPDIVDWLRRVFGQGPAGALMAALEEARLASELGRLEYSRKAKKLDTRLAETASEVKALSQQNETLKSDVTDLRAQSQRQATEFEAQLAAAQEAAQLLLSERNTLAADIERLAAADIAASEIARALGVKREALKDEVERTAGAAAAAAKRAAALEAERVTLANEVELVTAASAALSERAVALASELTLVRLDAQSKDTLTRELGAQLAEAFSAARALDVQKAEAETRVVGLAEELEIAARHRAEQDTLIIALGAEAQSRIEAIEKDWKIAAHQANERWKSEAASFELTISGLNDKNLALEAELEAMRRQALTFEERSTSVAEQLKSASDAFEALQARRAQLEDDLIRATQQAEAAVAENSQLAAERAAAASESAAHIARVEAELAAASDLARAMQEQRDGFEAAAFRALSEARALAKQKRELELKLSMEKSESETSLCAHMQELSHKEDSLRDQILRLEQDRQSLAGQVEQNRAAPSLTLAQAGRFHASATKARVKQTLKGAMRGLRRKTYAIWKDPRLDADVLKVRQSPIFNAVWYIEKYPDVARAGVDPALHYVIHGAAEGRDPGPEFSTAFYLQRGAPVSAGNPLVDYIEHGVRFDRDPNPFFKSRAYLDANPDVAVLGVNPLEHWLELGRDEGRPLFIGALRPTSMVLEAPQSETPRAVDLVSSTAPAAADSVKRRKKTADIIVPIHNSLDDVRLCLNALSRWRRPEDRVIIIDDGSASETRLVIHEFLARNPNDIHIRNQVAGGYTRAANQGIASTDRDYVFLLNSDTIVTPDWAAKLIAAAESDPRIGIVGPLSSAASWQSVPERYGPDGDWAINQLPPGFDVVLMGRVVEAVASGSPPIEVPLVNGFCFGIKRAVVEKIGGFDEARFPMGYGEENDFCFRAADAGFKLAIAIDAYVFHAKSRSFSHDRRRVLSKQGTGVLIETYGRARLDVATSALRENRALDQARIKIGALIQKIQSNDHLGILFLLPCRAGGGGVHSIIQEAFGLKKLGASVKIAVPEKFMGSYLAMYSQEYLSQIEGYDDVSEVIGMAESASVCIATINNSVELVSKIVAENSNILACYYVQDYEPMFYEPESDALKTAVESYSLVPNAVLFAKTNWIRDQVQDNHRVKVWRVQASIDKSIYHPNLMANGSGEIVRVSAMIRVGTPRRGPNRTFAVLKRLAEVFGQRVSITVFGSTDADLKTHQLLDPRIKNLGKLTREQVADCLRASDIFIDLSDYQAFGRTALEAMSCGCAVIVPEKGGGEEYALDGVNALVVDTMSEEQSFNALARLVSDGAFLERLKESALETAAGYSIENAVLSECILFYARFSAMREEIGKPTGRPKLPVVQ